MKIKKTHYNYIKKEIDLMFKKYNKDKLVEEYNKGLFPRSDKVKDLQKRFCFDMSFGAGLNKYICNNLYSYMNDEQLYTALKAICPKVSKDY